MVCQYGNIQCNNDVRKSSLAAADVVVVRIAVEVERVGASPFAPSPTEIFKGSDADFSRSTSAARTESRGEAAC